MCERNFSRAWNGAAAEKADIGNGVMRRARGSLQKVQPRLHRLTGGGMNAENIQVLLERRLGHDPGNPFCDHGLSGTGRTDHDPIVSLETNMKPTRFRRTRRPHALPAPIKEPTPKPS